MCIFNLKNVLLNKFYIIDKNLNYLLFINIFLFVNLINLTISDDSGGGIGSSDIRDKNLKLKKCCSINMELNIIIDIKNNNRTIYDCMPTTTTKFKNFTFIGDSINFINIYNDDDDLHSSVSSSSSSSSSSSNYNGIPKCENIEFYPFDKDGGSITTIDDCIDVYNGKLYGLKCKSMLTKHKQIEINLINKCCPFGLSYEGNQRYCADNRNDMELLKNNNIFKKSNILYTVFVPKCTDDEVFVEYQTNNHVMIFKDRTLKINIIDRTKQLYADILHSNAYCVDGLILTDTAIIDDTNNYSDISDNNNNNNNNNNNINNNINTFQILPPPYSYDKPSLIVRSCRPKTICNKIPCVKRCCKNDAMYAKVNNSLITQCVDYDRNLSPTFHNIDLPFSSDINYTIIEPTEYGFLHHQNCLKYALDPADPQDRHYISHIDGTLYVSNFAEPYSNNNYCIDFVQFGSEVEERTFICIEIPSQTYFTYYAIGSTISCIFLVITLTVYVCLPRLLNLQGKTLICYVITLLSAYIILATIQFHINTEVPHCHIFAYAMFFFFMSAFCWQSIMCFDIWWTFRSVRASRVMRKSKELRRFLLYILYAWGTPLLLTTFTFIVNFYELITEKWRPTFALNSCWFSKTNWRGHFLFFLLPNGLHVFTNAILFILTSLYCNKVKNEIHRMQKDNELDLKKTKRRFIADKAKLTMNLKLFVVMGVSWTLEIIATLYQSPKILWNILDTFNIFQGVLVCLIFVCKKKVFQSLSQRLGFSGKRKRGMGTTTTGVGTSIATTRDGLYDPYSTKGLRKSSSSSTVGVSPKNCRKTSK